MQQGPLSGYRIIEFGSNLSAPIATMLLGDQGAEVIKIEPPGGDQLRLSGAAREGVPLLGSMFVNANRNKRSVMLDLKLAADRETALQLAAGCDVVVQNFRPGVMERLGLGYEDVRRLRDDVVYVSIDGVGHEGPAAGRRIYDVVIQGMAGFAGVQADPVSGKPETMRTTVVDKATALCVWQAVTAALLTRQRTGCGQHVRVSMLDAALSFIWPETMGASTFVGEDVARGGSFAHVRYCYATADGYLVAGFASDGEFACLCRVIGRPDLLGDPRFADIGRRFANAEVLSAEVERALLQRSTAEWLDALAAEDAVYAPVNRPENLVDDPQIRALGSLEQHSHPIAGAYRQPRHPIRFADTPAGLHRHAPALGEHTAEVLAEFGLTGRRQDQEPPSS